MNGWKRIKVEKMFDIIYISLCGFGIASCAIDILKMIKEIKR
jgi:hypothetical protein